MAEHQNKSSLEQRNKPDSNIWNNFSGLHPRCNAFICCCCCYSTNCKGRNLLQTTEILVPLHCAISRHAIQSNCIAHDPNQNSTAPSSTTWLFRRIFLCHSFIHSAEKNEFWIEKNLSVEWCRKGGMITKRLSKLDMLFVLKEIPHTKIIVSICTVPTKRKHEIIISLGMFCSRNEMRFVCFSVSHSSSAFQLVFLFWKIGNVAFDFTLFLIQTIHLMTSSELFWKFNANNYGRNEGENKNAHAKSAHYTAGRLELI